MKSFALLAVVLAVASAAPGVTSPLVQLIVNIQQESSASPVIDRPQPEASVLPAPIVDRPQPEASIHPAPIVDRPQPEATILPAPIVDRPQPEVSFVPNPVIIDRPLPEAIPVNPIDVIAINPPMVVNPIDNIANPVEDIAVGPAVVAGPMI